MYNTLCDTTCDAMKETMYGTMYDTVHDVIQVLIASAVGAAATQKHVLDLWWTTTFLAPEGKTGPVLVSLMHRLR